MGRMATDWRRSSGGAPSHGPSATHIKGFQFPARRLFADESSARAAAAAHEAESDEQARRHSNKPSQESRSSVDPPSPLTSD